MPLTPKLGLDLTDAPWRTSSFTANVNCVEVADFGPAGVAVRDSKNPTGPVLEFNPREWRAFLDGCAAGEFG